MSDTKISANEQQRVDCCAVCGLTKPLSEFHKAQLGRKSRRPWCKECCRDYQLNKKFGLSLVSYSAMLERQGGRCGICGSLDPGTNAKGQHCVDHDHVTGKVRGLLCNRCNTGLGSFRDAPDVLRRAAEYIEAHHEVPRQLLCSTS